jgi:hypothetical protein
MKMRGLTPVILLPALLLLGQGSGLPLPAAPASGAPPRVAQTSGLPASPSVEGDFVLRDFRFTTGEALPELKLHCL